MFGATKCKSTGDLKIYAINPKHGLFRYDEKTNKREWMHWDDPRLQCREIPVTTIDDGDGDEELPTYECPYASTSFDDLDTIIDQALVQ